MLLCHEDVSVQKPLGYQRVILQNSALREIRVCLCKEMETQGSATALHPIPWTLMLRSDDLHHTYHLRRHRCMVCMVDMVDN